MAFSLLVMVKMVLSLSLENHIIIHFSHSCAYLLTPRIKVEVRCYGVGAHLGPMRKPEKEEGDGLWTGREPGWAWVLKEDPEETWVVTSYS